MTLRRPWTWLALAGVSGGGALCHALPSWPALMPACTIRRFTGLHCPGCGGTRCAVTLIALVFSGVIAAGVWQEWKGGSGRVFPTWLAWSLTGLVVVFGLVRNLPWWPFTLLVPH